MLTKILKATNTFILNGSCSMILVGGAMLVMGGLYRLGKELGYDISRAREARAERMNGNG